MRPSQEPDGGLILENQFEILAGAEACAWLGKTTLNASASLLSYVLREAVNVTLELQLKHAAADLLVLAIDGYVATTDPAAANPYPQAMPRYPHSRLMLTSSRDRAGFMFKEYANYLNLLMENSPTIRD